MGGEHTCWLFSNKCVLAWRLGSHGVQVCVLTWSPGEEGRLLNVRTVESPDSCQCVGLHTLHRLLQAKRGVMARQIAIDAQRCTTKAHAEEMAMGWGEVVLHPKPSDAIMAGACTRWSANNVPHWDCQTLQC